MPKKHFFRDVLQSAPLPVAFLGQVENDFRVLYMNDAAEEVVALSQEEVSSGTLREIFPQIPGETHREMLRIFSEEISPQAYGVHYQNRLERYHILRVIVSRRDDGLLITGESLHHRPSPIQIYHPSSYDGLTGILLRDQFFYYAERELFSCRSRQVGSAVLMIDLDRFKAINDEKGHAAGDRVLSRVSETLSDLVRYSDILGRYGGDEIVLLVPGASPEIAEEIARRICRSLRYPTASVGIALSAPEDDSTLEELIALADQAMYEAKGRGGDQYEIKNL